MKNKKLTNKFKWIQIGFDKALYEIECLAEDRTISEEDYERLEVMQRQLEKMRLKYN